MTKVLPNDWRARPELERLIDVLGGGIKTRLVGGAVRDGLLGVPVSDIDLATRLLPAEVIARLDAARIKAVPTGIAHGTVTAVTAEGPVEVTTLRRDVSTDGRHATVVFSDDWREDAARRDFTINALYADAATGKIFDWFGGLDDLEARRVRFIGDPLVRIAEDHLRILRFFRFHARFAAGPPDAAGFAACVARANDLMALSRERIASEILKTLGTDDPVAVIRLMIECGIFRPVLPELGDSEKLDRLVTREKTFGIAPDPVRRLAALIGPAAETAKKIAARLKFSNAITRRLVLATGPADDRADALAYRLGVESTFDRLLLNDGSRADFAALADWQRPVLPISGGKLIDRGLSPGPQVAETLAHIETQWIAARYPVGDAFENLVAAAIRAAVSKAT
jgi:poly(A) polymerase